MYTDTQCCIINNKEYYIEDYYVCFIEIEAGIKDGFIERKI